MAWRYDQRSTIVGSGSLYQPELSLREAREAVDELVHYIHVSRISKRHNDESLFIS